MLYSDSSFLQPQDIKCKKKINFQSSNQIEEVEDKGTKYLTHVRTKLSVNS